MARRPRVLGRGTRPLFHRARLRAFPARDVARGELDGNRIVSKETAELAFSDQLNGLPLPEFVPTQASWLMNDMVAVSPDLGIRVPTDVRGRARNASRGHRFLVGSPQHLLLDRPPKRTGSNCHDTAAPLFDAAILATVAAFESAVYAALQLRRWISRAAGICIKETNREGV